MPDRINVQNNPVNMLDIYGLAAMTVYANPSWAPRTRFGHAWVVITYDSGLSETFGNYPGGPRYNDAPGPQSVSRTWQISETQAMAARDSVTKPLYTLLDDNCVDRTENALGK